jgi:tetratricopeptide (TPR) repeat protein
VRADHDAFAPTANDSTRQVAASEVAALVARTRGREAAADVAMGSPPPFRAPAPIVPDTWKGERGAAPAEARSMREAIDAELDDALADDIDQQVAAELSGRAMAPGYEAPTPTATADLGAAELGDDELPFDPAAARAFDAVMRRQAYPHEASTFDGGAASTPGSFSDGDGATRLGLPPEFAPEAYEAATVGTATDDDAYAGYADPPAYDSGGGTLDEVRADYDDRPLEDVLETADDYAANGMYREAMAELRALLARHPGHPLVSMRLRDLETAAAGEGQGTQTVDVEDLEEIAPDELEPEVDPEDDVAVAFDEAQRVLAARHDPSLARARPAVVLEHPLEDSDADNQFDLGLACKEMGLFDEAIKAFHKVTGTPAREVQSRMMIGLCHREQGNLSEAVHQFKAGLHAQAITDRERQGLLYEIGTTYEALGDPREAVYYFEMVVKRDPKFLDAAARMQRLRGSRAADPIDQLLDEE